MAGDSQEKNTKLGMAFIRFKSTVRDSPCWADLVKVKYLYIKGKTMVVRGGRQTDFWGDACIGNMPLKDQYLELFVIGNENAKIVRKMAKSGWNLSFKRWLDNGRMTQLNRLRTMLQYVNVTLGEEDSPKWSWNMNVKFTVKTMYNHLGDVGPYSACAFVFLYLIRFSLYGF